MFTTGMLGESKITPYRRSGEKKKFNSTVVLLCGRVV